MSDAPATNDSELPLTHDSETPTIARGRRGSRPIDRTMNDSEISSVKPSNRRRRLSSASSEGAQSSSQADDDRPQKVTDVSTPSHSMSSCTDLNILLKFKVRVVERVVEREVVPAHLTQQLAEKDEQIQLLQQKLEAEVQSLFVLCSCTLNLSL